LEIDDLYYHPNRLQQILIAMRMMHLLCILCLAVLSTPICAQDLAMLTPNAAAFGPSATFHLPTAAPVTSLARATRYEPVVAIKRANKVSAAYEGFAIVVATAELPLLSDDPIFRQFGNLTYDQNADGTYSYLILTPFTKKKNVKRFLEGVIKGKSPNATIVKYKAGKKK
jgi:hypothetical protein